MTTTSASSSSFAIFNEKRNLYLTQVIPIVHLYQTEFVVHLPRVLTWLIHSLEDECTKSTIYKPQQNEAKDEAGTTNAQRIQTRTINALLNMLDALFSSCWPVIHYSKINILIVLIRASHSYSYWQNILERILSSICRLGLACEDHAWVRSRLVAVQTQMKHAQLKGDGSGMIYLVENYDRLCQEILTELEHQPPPLTWYTMQQQSKVDL